MLIAILRVEKVGIELTPGFAMSKWRGRDLRLDNAIRNDWDSTRRGIPTTPTSSPRSDGSRIKA